MPRRASSSGVRIRPRRWRTRPARRAREAWTSGRAARIIGCSRFGTAICMRSTCAAGPWRVRHGGRVSLVPEGARSFGWSSGPIVVGDVVVIAGNLDGAGDGGTKWKGSPPEDVRGFDARAARCSGRSTSCRAPASSAPTPGATTRGSSRAISARGAACRRTKQLGYVYIPLTAPTAAYYGGHQPGRQPVLERAGRARREDRQARLAFSDGPSRPLGVRPPRSGDAG